MSDGGAHPLGRWCEHCRRHVDANHYDGDGNHLAGIEYGWFGKLLAAEHALRRFVAVMEPLMSPMDGDDGQPVMAAPSCWEFVGVDRDAGELYEEVRSLWREARTYVGDDVESETT